VIVSYASGSGRHVVLADANPAIATLSRVTWRSLDQARLAPRATPPPPPVDDPAAPVDEPAGPVGEPAAPDGAAPQAPAAQPVGWRSGRGQPPPNLGPPPEPPDWRNRRH
jgi:hypothetical protein